MKKIRLYLYNRYNNSKDKCLFANKNQLLAACCLVVANQAALAVTKLNQTFTPYVGSSHKYDSNLLRAPEGNTTDSFINQIKAGINVDWRYSLQEVIINAEFNQNWYSGQIRNPQNGRVLVDLERLDYLGHNVLAQWNWAAGSRLTGQVGYGHEEALGTFSQLNNEDPVNLITSNYNTTQRYFANAEYQLLPDVYIAGKYNGNESRYSDQDTGRNLTEHSGEISVQYRNQSKTMVGFRVVLSDGKYQRPSTDRFDNAYFRHSYNVDWQYKFSDKLRVSGFAGYLQQDYENRTTLNFSDAVAQLDLNWIPSEKTSLQFSIWQLVSQAFTQNSNFVLSKGLRIIPVWLPTQKIRVELPFSYENQAYLADPSFFDGEDGPDSRGPQQDDVIDLGLNIIYNPWVNTEFALNFTHENRDSNYIENTYETQTIGVSAKVEF